MATFPKKFAQNSPLAVPKAVPPNNEQRTARANNNAWSLPVTHPLRRPGGWFAGARSRVHGLRRRSRPGLPGRITAEHPRQCRDRGRPELVHERADDPAHTPLSVVIDAEPP